MQCLFGLPKSKKLQDCSTEFPSNEISFRFPKKAFWNFQFQVIYSQTPGPTITFLLTREVQCVSCIVPVFIRTPIVFFMIQFNSLILFFHRIMYRNITESYLAFSAQIPHPPATPQGLRPLGQMEVW